MKYYLVHVDAPRIGRLLYIVTGDQDTWFNLLDESVGGMHEVLHTIIDEEINPERPAPAIRAAREGEIRIDPPRHRATQLFITAFYEISEEIATKHPNLYSILEI